MKDGKDESDKVRWQRNEVFKDEAIFSNDSLRNGNAKIKTSEPKSG